MATYKVLQDIEAEDKLVGPLSLRQFIYAAASAVSLYICFLGLSKGAGFLVVLFLPVGLIGGFFAFPWKGEQPTEIWALARLRFMIKPRVRIWNQSGVKEIVTITVPKKIDDGRPKPRNLSQTEVRSRLKALADTIDSRGWATRNVNFRYYSNAQQGNVDRLVNASDLQPGSVPLDAFLPANDMLDGQSLIAQTIDTKLSQGAVYQRQLAQAFAAGQQSAAITQPQTTPVQTLQMAQPLQITQPAQLAAQPIALAIQAAAPVQQIQTTAPQSMPQLPAPVMTPPATSAPIAIADQPSAPVAPVDTNWFTSELPTAAAPVATQPVIASPAPAIVTAPPIGPPPAPTEPVTRPTDPAILKLANNNDLNVATLARQAKKEVKRNGNEVEVSLR